MPKKLINQKKKKKFFLTLFFNVILKIKRRIQKWYKYIPILYYEYFNLIKIL